MKLLNKLDELRLDSHVETLEIEVEPRRDAWYSKDAGRQDIEPYEGR